MRASRAGRGRFPPPGAPDSGLDPQQSLSALPFFCTSLTSLFGRCFARRSFSPPTNPGLGEVSAPPPEVTHPDTYASSQFHLFLCTKKPSFFCKYLTQIFTVHARLSPPQAEGTHTPPGGQPSAPSSPFLFLPTAEAQGFFL